MNKLLTSRLIETAYFLHMIGLNNWCCVFAFNVGNQINICCFWKQKEEEYLTVSPLIWNTSPKFPPLIEYVISLLFPSSLSVAFTCITWIPAVKFPSVKVTVIVGGVNSGALSLMSVTWTVTSLRPFKFKASYNQHECSCKWIYEIYIWTAEKDMKTWLIMIAVIHTT